MQYVNRALTYDQVAIFRVPKTTEFINLYEESTSIGQQQDKTGSFFTKKDSICDHPTSFLHGYLRTFISFNSIK